MAHRYCHSCRHYPDSKLEDIELSGNLPPSPPHHHTHSLNYHTPPQLERLAPARHPVTPLVLTTLMTWTKKKKKRKKEKDKKFQLSTATLTLSHNLKD